MSGLQEVGHINNSCFDFPVLSMFTFDVFWGSLSISTFDNSGSATNNTRTRLPSRYFSVSYENGNTLKFSYSCMPNLESLINSHS